jgi:hypothetical protein
MLKPLFKSAEDERRDAMGRWTRDMERKGVTLHGTTGILGLSRDRVVAKLKDILDGLSGEPVLGHPLSRYLGAAAGFAASRIPGMPAEIQDNAPIAAAHLAEHIREATGNVVGKVMEHPRFKELATKAAKRAKRVRKALDATDEQQLKNILAAVMADTRMPPQVNYSDAALTAVADSAYRQLCSRIGAC